MPQQLFWANNPWQTEVCCTLFQTDSKFTIYCKLFPHFTCMPMWIIVNYTIIYGNSLLSLSEYYRSNQLLSHSIAITLHWCQNTKNTYLKYYKYLNFAPRVIMGQSFKHHSQGSVEHFVLSWFFTALLTRGIQPATWKCSTQHFRDGTGSKQWQTGQGA